MEKDADHTPFLLLSTGEWNWGGTVYYVCVCHCTLFQSFYLRSAQRKLSQVAADMYVIMEMS